MIADKQAIRKEYMADLLNSILKGEAKQSRT